MDGTSLQTNTKTINRSTNVKSSFILTITALIWGLAFVAQRSGMEFVGPFLFMGIRMLLGALTLVVIVVLMDFVRKMRKKPIDDNKSLDNPKSEPNASKLTGTTLLKAGLACGAVLFLAGSAQQVGLVFTTASKAGFLTALYIVLVPILGLFIRHKTHWNTWLSVAIAAVGLYFLCIKDSFIMELGDISVLGGAFFWACHILVIDHFVADLKQRDILKLCVAQFIAAAVLAFIASPMLDGFFASGTFDLSAITAAMPAILFTGILSTGVAFTLQAIGQRVLRFGKVHVWVVPP